MSPVPGRVPGFSGTSPVVSPKKNMLKGIARNGLRVASPMSPVFVQ